MSQYEFTENFSQSLTRNCGCFSVSELHFQRLRLIPASPKVRRSALKFEKTAMKRRPSVMGTYELVAPIKRYELGRAFAGVPVTVGVKDPTRHSGPGEGLETGQTPGSSQSVVLISRRSRPGWDGEVQFHASGRETN